MQKTFNPYSIIHHHFSICIGYVLIKWAEKNLISHTENLK